MGYVLSCLPSIKAHDADFHHRTQCQLVFPNELWSEIDGSKLYDRR
jgi:hypothetical protein